MSTLMKFGVPVCGLGAIIGGLVFYKFVKIKNYIYIS